MSWELGCLGLELLNWCLTLRSPFHEHFFFLDHVHHFDAGHGALGRLSRHASQHRADNMLHGTMIPLHAVVVIGHLADVDAVERPRRRQDVCRVDPLPSACLLEPLRLAMGQPLLERSLTRSSSARSRPKPTRHRIINAGVHSFHPLQVLPVHTCPHRTSGPSG
jgi:hypothetical protein